MREHPNLLLTAMETTAYEDIMRYGAIVPLATGAVIADTHAGTEKVYFPHTGIISCRVALVGGGLIETAMIGRDGVFGALLALAGNKSFNPATVQVDGVATVVEARVFADLFERHSGLRRQILAYEQTHLSDVQQTAACNAVHSVLARTCRTLLRMHELVGSDIAITQECLSQMMGVRRTSVTEAAKTLQESEAILLRRGRIQIIDCDKVAAHACECHNDIHRHDHH